MGLSPANGAKGPDLSSGLLDLLERNTAFNHQPLSSLQREADELVSGFVAHATDWKSLASMAAGGMAYRLARIGAMGAGSGSLIRALSVGVGLTAEVAAFEGTHRGLITLSGKGESNLWRWDGSAGLRQGLLQSFITFGTLKGFGKLTQSQNLILQHGAQDLGMVLGHQLVYRTGVGPKPEGTLAEQLVHAEVTNLQLGAGMALMHRTFPGLASLEKGIDLSLGRGQTGPLLRFADPFPQLAFQTAGLGNHRMSSPESETSEIFNTRSFMISSEGGEAAPISRTTTIPRENIETYSRGGVVVKTSKGLIQLGVPMWTNKDAFSRFIQQNGFGKPKDEIAQLVPTTYVFDLDYVRETEGLLPADFLQYMFFVTKGTQFTLVAPDPSIQGRLETFLNLSFQGPRDESLTERVRREYLTDPYGIPDLGREISEGFPAPGPEVLRRVVSLDDRGEFCQNGVTIRKLGSQKYEIIDDGASLGEVNLKEFPLPEPELKRNPQSAQDPAVQRVREQILMEGRPGLLAIGTGHGFTPEEETSGFMIWNRGKALLVDPPSSTLEFLYAHGIPPEVIEGVLLTHGHTDHHGNAIPKLLRELPKVNVYTTHTIFDMLQKQYELALGNHGEGIRQWNFTALHPQQFTKILGLYFRPDYSFHTVPAIGFEIYNRPNLQSGRLLTLFTGDTFAHFSDVWRHVQPGPEGRPPLMTPERALNVMRHMSLLFRFSKQNPPPVMLVEGGIAPIHIDPKNTRQLLDFAERYGVDTSHVRIYHIGEQPAKQAGVTKWSPGPQGFIDLSDHLKSRPRPIEKYLAKRLMSLPLEPLSDLEKAYLATVGILERVPEGKILLREGEEVLVREGGELRAVEGAAMYVMIDGEVEISREGNTIAHRSSGFFGEGVLFAEARNATAKTTVPSLVLKLEGDALNVFRDNPQIMLSILDMRKNRREAYEAVLQSPLGRLSDSTLDLLFGIGKTQRVSPGESLISEGDATRDVFIVLEGKAHVFNTAGTVDATLKKGAMIGEMALVNNSPRSASIVAQEDGLYVLRLPADKIEDLMDDYPGIRIALTRTAVLRNGG